jgi:hypothetical protein
MDERRNRHDRRSRGTRDRVRETRRHAAKAADDLVIRHGDDLYVRSVNGRTSSWFRGAQASHEAHIEAGGVDKDVLLVETDDMNDKLDAAYRAKYRRYAESIVGSIVSPNARAATLKLVPR